MAMAELLLEKAHGGFVLASATVVLTVLLELVSLDAVREVLAQPQGPALYQTAIAVNFLNHYVFGIPVYTVATLFFCRPRAADSDKDLDEWSLSSSIVWSGAVRVLGIVWIHDFLYWFVHRTMHSRPELYVYHKFHHRFHAHVPPVSANAVSVVEYVVAYILPFAMAAWVVAPTEGELSLAVMLTSIANLFLHTPSLVSCSRWLVPPLFASTVGHMEHHKRLTTHYSAPVWNFDWILAQPPALFFAKQK